MELAEPFCWGVFGGVAVEAVQWFLIRRRKVPEDMVGAMYWGSTIAMVLVGGGFAAGYAASGITLPPYLAIHIGASAPVALTAMAKSTPEITPTVS